MSLDAKNYPSNSRKNSNKKVEKVISGKVKRPKPSIGKRFKSIFFSEDIDSVSSYVLYDILIPAAKNMLFDVIEGGAKATLFGEKSGHRTSRYKSASYLGTNVRHINYNQPSREPQRSTVALDRRAAHDFDDIIFESRGEAEAVLSHMVDIVEEYSVVSVADFYGLCGLHHTSVDQNYGWDTLISSKVVAVRDGWVLELPKTRRID